MADPSFSCRTYFGLVVSLDAVFNCAFVPACYWYACLRVVLVSDELIAAPQKPRIATTTPVTTSVHISAIPVMPTKASATTQMPKIAFTHCCHIKVLCY